MCYKRRRLILLKHNRVKGHWSLCSTWETASCSFLAQIFSKAVNYPAESPSLICARALCNPPPPALARWQAWAISWGTVGCVQGPGGAHGCHTASQVCSLTSFLTSLKVPRQGAAAEPSMLRLLKIKHEAVSDVYAGLAAELIDATLGVCGSELYWIDSNELFWTDFHMHDCLLLARAN